MSLEQHRAAASHRALRFAVITISDTRDAASDRGGPFLVDGLVAAGHQVTFREIVKDDSEPIASSVQRAVSAVDVDLVLTTGGTGIAPRDVTVPTLEKLFESTIPGFGELFRMLSFRAIGSAAILSRATAGLIGGKVVIALPGSPKALELALGEIILKEAGHLVTQTRGPG
ncbi:MAG: molybdenum cofactor biosynthesis protein MoaB [Planctomycetes bacterium]|nr:molybdenum cofactor biosynthesis protein MoaB [Planctomycetota bacterium]